MVTVSQVLVLGNVNFVSHAPQLTKKPISVYKPTAYQTIAIRPQTKTQLSKTWTLQSSLMRMFLVARMCQLTPSTLTTRLLIFSVTSRELPHLICLVIWITLRILLEESYKVTNLLLKMEVAAVAAWVVATLTLSMPVSQLLVLHSSMLSVLRNKTHSILRPEKRQRLAQPTNVLPILPLTVNIITISGQTALTTAAQVKDQTCALMNLLARMTL